MSACIVCGKQLVRDDSRRCADHRALYQRIIWAHALRPTDKAILAMAGTMTHEQIGQRLGVSTSRAGQKVRAAKQRAAFLEGLDYKMTRLDARKVNDIRAILPQLP